MIIDCEILRIDPNNKYYNIRIIFRVRLKLILGDK